MRNISKQAILCVLGVWLCGCGSSGPSFDELCNQAASSVCDKEISCGTEQASARAACLDRIKAEYCPNKASYCKAGLTYDSSRGQACSDALKNLTCSMVDDPSPPEACTPNALCTTASSSSGSDDLAACKSFASAFCSFLGRCGGTNGIEEMPFASVSDCTSAAQAQCGSKRGFCSGSSACSGPPGYCDNLPVRTFSASNARVCASGLSSVSCTAIGALSACGEVCQYVDEPGGTGGTSGGGGSGGSGGNSDTSACMNYLSASCRFLDRCNLLSTTPFHSTSECISFMQSMCTTDGVCLRSSSGNTFSASVANACASRFDSQSCSSNPPSECQQLCQ